MTFARYENENQLRQLVKAAWAKPFSISHALIVKGPDRFEMAKAFKMFASELGARFVVLDIESDAVLDEQVELLKRKGPRIVLITGLEKLSEENLSSFPDVINAGGRALPVFPIIEEPEEDFGEEDGSDAEDDPPFDLPAQKAASQEEPEIA